jgi:16S rRNA (cytosine967-C5)-methyltransferase
VKRPSARAVSARDIAARVLVRVQVRQAFASAVLEAELSSAVQLEPRERAFATDLVYGTLRVWPWLERQLGELAPRGIAKLDDVVRSHLFVAAYQLAFTRVPAFASVDQAVQAVRTARGARLAGFANAMLRKFAARLARAGPIDREQVVISCAPEWLRDRLGDALGDAGAVGFLRAGAQPPPVALRVEERSSRDEWISRLAAFAQDASFEAGRVSPLAIIARGASKPQRLPGWAEGAWSVQEEGAQLAALALGARPGEVVLDACAGRGNKTAILAREVGTSGAVDVADAFPAKLERLRTELARVHLGARATFAVDWRVGSGAVPFEYDRILVDAPCSGIGTLRRRPDLALRRGPEALAACVEIEVALAARVAQHVRPGGSLVYVVCSILREEGEAVLERLLRLRPELVPVPFDVPEVRAVAGDATSFRLLPHVHGTDGYFLARLSRTSTT